MTAIIIVALTMTIPVSAIIANAVIKYKKLDNEKHGSLSQEEVNTLVDSIKRLKAENDQIKAQNEELAHRLENLEKRLPAAEGSSFSL